MSRHAVAHVSDAREILIVLAGFVAAVFLAGAVIGRLLHPFALKLHRGTVPGIENAGRMIGWLERTLLYGLILAGAPDAAAIVIAAKSVARFPAFSEESFCRVLPDRHAAELPHRCRHRRRRPCGARTAPAAVGSPLSRRALSRSRRQGAVQRVVQLTTAHRMRVAGLIGP